MNKVIAFLRMVNHDWDDSFHYCGYIGIEKDDNVPVSYQSSCQIDDKTESYLDDYINVHGGITFDGNFNEVVPIIPITNIPENWYTYHCYGFDLNHLDDDITGTSVDFNFAKSEVLSMKKQMEALLDRISSSTGE